MGLRWMPKDLADRQSGSVANGMPEKDLVVGDTAEVNAGFDLKHVGD